jgi:hypothetical protein
MVTNEEFMSLLENVPLLLARCSVDEIANFARMVDAMAAELVLETSTESVLAYGGVPASAKSADDVAHRPKGRPPHHSRDPVRVDLVMLFPDQTVGRDFAQDETSAAALSVVCGRTLPAAGRRDASIKDQARASSIDCQLPELESVADVDAVRRALIGRSPVVCRVADPTKERFEAVVLVGYDDRTRAFMAVDPISFAPMYFSYEIVRNPKMCDDFWVVGPNGL